MKRGSQENLWNVPTGGIETYRAPVQGTRWLPYWPVYNWPNWIIGSNHQISAEPGQPRVLDIKAAYDSVPRAELWRRCEIVGLPAFLIWTLRALFDHNSSQLAIEQKFSSLYGLSAGILQGSVLSPLLYSIYLDLLVFKLRILGPGVRLGSESASENFINTLLYADDSVLIANSQGNLQKLLVIALQYTLWFGPQSARYLVTLSTQCKTFFISSTSVAFIF